MRTTASLVCLLFLALVACEPASPKSPDVEQDVPLDGALDSFRGPVDHGALTLGTVLDPSATTAELTREQAFHSWTFALDRDASLTLHTAATDGGPVVDTMLYLYREGARGWGPHVARDDDGGDALFSALSLTLRAGRYRVLVKGYDRRALGPFALLSECAGDGCPTAMLPCLFGGTYREMRDSATFEPEQRVVITSIDSLAPEHAAQLLAAVRVAYEEASDTSSALASVDEAEINVLALLERATGRRFRAYEYGAGDNSYGAIFAGDDPTIVAEIHDGDLYACTVLGMPQGARAGADCDVDAVCASGLACQGVVPSRGLGRCAPLAPIEGEGEPCSATRACAGETLCSGLTSSESGLCVPPWMRGSTGETWALEIPDDGELARNETIYGLGAVATDVELRALVQHPRHDDLRITLTSPAGTEHVVFDGAPSTGALELDVPVLGVAGEPANGDWSLRVVDRATGSTGSLERWAIDVTSRRE